MKENEVQFNTEVDGDLIRRVNIDIAEQGKGMNKKKWTTAAFELALNFAPVAEEHCRSLGWTEPQPPGIGAVPEGEEIELEVQEAKPISKHRAKFLQSKVKVKHS